MYSESELDEISKFYWLQKKLWDELDVEKNKDRILNDYTEDVTEGKDDADVTSTLAARCQKMLSQKSKYSYKRYLDFTNENHLYRIFGEFYGLEVASENCQFDSNLPLFIETLNYYIKQTTLAPVYQEILDLKLKKIRNIKIVEIVNPKWGKSYTPNYISTINICK